MSQLGQDLRLAWRHLRQAPGFTAVAGLTLALGLGANITVFTLVHSLILRTLPVERPHELYRLGDTMDCCVNSGLAGSYSLFSYRLFEHLKRNAPEFSELAAFQANASTVTLRRTGEAAGHVLPAAFVTGNYFTMFGVRPFAGRVLTADDDRPGAAPAMVISYQAWTREFGGDPSIVNTAVTIAGRSLTVVGIAAPEFFGDTVRPDPAAAWIPIAQEPWLRGVSSLLEREDQNWLYAIGRLRATARPEQAAARLTAALRQWLPTQPFIVHEDRSAVGRQRVAIVSAAGGVQQARQQYSRALTLLFAASGMVLLIAIANLANLLLARADRGQAAIRAALGAPTGRLVRQALTEGILLALAGSVAGMVVAAVATRALVRVAFPMAAFVPVDAAPSPAVWLFALGLAILTGGVFSAAPAWAMSRTAPLEALTGAGRGGQSRSLVPRGSLLIVQVALSLALLSSAGLLAGSLGNLEHQRLGFTPSNRIVVFIDPPPIAGDIPRLVSLFARVEDGLGRLPGVRRVACAMYSPMEGNNWSSGIAVGGRAANAAQPQFSSWNRVSAGYFETVGTRVLQGRGIDERDGPSGKRVAVVNETFVKKVFKGDNPLGQTVGIGGAAHAGDYEIVGVVEDVKYSGAQRREVRPMMFLPAFQTVAYESESQRGVQARSTLLKAIVLETSGNGGALEAAIRRAAAGIDPGLGVIRVVTLERQVSANFRMERLMAGLTSAYGLLALALAALGLYGVAAYAVARRTREIGIRMALGAARWRVVGGAMCRPLLQTAVGLALGVAASVGVGHVLRSQLYEMTGLNASVLVVAMTALLASATAAAAWPARRAASVNPAQALRSE